MKNASTKRSSSVTVRNWQMNWQNSCYAAPREQLQHRFGPSKRKGSDSQRAEISASSPTGRVSHCASSRLKPSKSCHSTRSLRSSRSLRAKATVRYRSGRRPIHSTSPVSALERDGSSRKACLSPASTSRSSTNLQAVRPNHAFNRTREYGLWLTQGWWPRAG